MKQLSTYRREFDDIEGIFGYRKIQRHSELSLWAITIDKYFFQDAFIRVEMRKLTGNNHQYSVGHISQNHFACFLTNSRILGEVNDLSPVLRISTK